MKVRNFYLSGSQKHIPIFKRRKFAHNRDGQSNTYSDYKTYNIKLPSFEMLIDIHGRKIEVMTAWKEKLIYFQIICATQFNPT